MGIPPSGLDRGRSNFKQSNDEFHQKYSGSTSWLSWRSELSSGFVWSLMLRKSETIGRASGIDPNTVLSLGIGKVKEFWEACYWVFLGKSWDQNGKKLSAFNNDLYGMAVYFLPSHRYEYLVIKVGDGHLQQNISTVDGFWLNSWRL